MTNSLANVSFGTTNITQKIGALMLKRLILSVITFLLLTSVSLSPSLANSLILCPAGQSLQLPAAAERAALKKFSGLRPIVSRSIPYIRTRAAKCDAKLAATASHWDSLVPLSVRGGWQVTVSHSASRSSALRRSSVLFVTKTKGTWTLIASVTSFMPVT